MDELTNEVLLRKILQSYEALERPEFFFVERAMSLRPYDTVVRDLRMICELGEITDSNDDVSFRYLLSGPVSQWVVELSMVGPFAVVLRLDKAGTVELVDPDATVVGQKIFSVLVKHKIDVLRESMLTTPVTLNLQNTDRNNVCFYQALFSDTDILPWKAGS